MRYLTANERSQRGCSFCTEMKKSVKDRVTDPKMSKGERVLCCPHKECPFHELDGYRSYADYLRATDAEFKGLLDVARGGAANEEVGRSGSRRSSAIESINDIDSAESSIRKNKHRNQKRNASKGSSRKDDEPYTIIYGGGNRWDSTKG